MEGAPLVGCAVVQEMASLVERVVAVVQMAAGASSHWVGSAAAEAVATQEEALMVEEASIRPAVSVAAVGMGVV